MGELFAAVVAGAPPGIELEKKFDVEPSTVWRWAKGKSAPPLAEMREVVSTVRERLTELLEQATTAEDVLRLVTVAVDHPLDHVVGEQFGLDDVDDLRLRHCSRCPRL